MSASMLFGKPNWGWRGEIVTCTGDFSTSHRVVSLIKVLNQNPQF